MVRILLLLLSNLLLVVQRRVYTPCLLNLCNAQIKREDKYHLIGLKTSEWRNHSCHSEPATGQRKGKHPAVLPEQALCALPCLLW